MSEPKPDELVPGEEASPPGLDRGVDETSTLGTLARLLVGGALLGRDAIGSAMASAVDTSREPTKPMPGGEAASDGDLAEASDIPRPTPSARHLLIGALFDTGEQIERRGASAARLVGRATSPAVRWAKQSRLTSPARRRFNALSAQGEARVRRWVERGVLEEQRSRALLNAAVSKTTNTSLDRVVASPQVQGLVEEFVQAQGQSLGRRVLEELRALAVSGDHSVARLARRILRHPRSEVAPVPRAVPASASPAPPPHLRGRAAGFVSRLVAFLLDVILISILIRATGWLLEDIRMVTGTYFYLPAFTNLGDLTVPIHVTVIGGLLISTAYFVFFWALAGVTPGKGLVGLRVVTRDGRPPSLVRSAVRLLGYLLSLLLYGLGFWWIAIDNWREGWHDKLARTAVIYGWDAHPSDRSLNSVMGTPEELQ